MSQLEEGLNENISLQINLNESSTICHLKVESQKQSKETSDSLTIKPIDLPNSSKIFLKLAIK